MSSWWDDAACAEIGPEIFYPDLGENADDARRICNTCPVATACLQAALAEERGLYRGHRHGVRGGLTPSERYQLDKPTPRARPRRRSTVTRPVTERRTQVRSLATAGLATAEIARHLGVSTRTIARDRRTLGIPQITPKTGQAA